MKKIFFLLLFILVSGIIYYQTIFVSKENQKEKGEVTAILIKTKIDEKNEELGWKKLSCGLWKNKDGDIGYKVSFIGRDPAKAGIYYITKFDSHEEEESLSRVIDTTTFHRIGSSSYYKDKNHIYHYFDMAYGGIFYIKEDIDHITFQILNSFYGKDKNYVYLDRGGVLKEVDIVSFRVIEDSPFAKDKNNYYHWGNVISIEEIRVFEKETGIKIL